MIRDVVSRLTPLILPAGILGACVAAIFGLRGFSAKPKAAQLMQAEMNRQFDTFQVALQEASATQLKLQQKAVQAEQLRIGLTDQFERSQRELIETQRALQAANESLLSTQAALRRMIDDYELLRQDKLAQAEKKVFREAEQTASNDSANFTKGRQELEKLRQECLRLDREVSQGIEYFDRLWTDYTEINYGLATVARQISGRNMERDEISPGPVASARSDFGPKVFLEDPSYDTPPQLSPRLLNYWLSERMAVRSAELIGLQRKLTRVNQAIAELSQVSATKQRELSKAQARLSEQTSTR